MHFELHASFQEPVRVIKKPPYEVMETGWGQFEVRIKIFFHDIAEEVRALAPAMLRDRSRPVPAFMRPSAAAPFAAALIRRSPL